MTDASGTAKKTGFINSATDSLKKLGEKIPNITSRSNDTTLSKSDEAIKEGIRKRKLKMTIEIDNYNAELKDGIVEITVGKPAEGATEVATPTAAADPNAGKDATEVATPNAGKDATEVATPNAGKGTQPGFGGRRRRTRRNKQRRARRSRKNI